MWYADVPPLADSKNDMRVGLFVTCLVDLMRPGIGFAAIKLLEAAGCEVYVPRDADLLRPAGVQLRRPRVGPRARREGARRVRGMRVRRRAVGFVRGNDQDPLPRPLPGRRLRARPHRATLRPGLRAHRLPRQRRRARRPCRAATPARSPITIPAPACASSASSASRARCSRRVPGLELREMDDCEQCCGFGGTFAVKFGDGVGGDRRPQVRDDRGERRRRGRARRPRLHAEHRRAGCGGAGTRP